MMALQTVFESRDVERDIVIDEENRSRAMFVSVTNVIDDAVDVEAMEIPAAHLDDRTETAVECAAARSLDNVDLPSQKRVAG